MRILYYCFLIFLIISCSDDDEHNFLPGDTIPGKWILVEAYSDPGDGSGDYEPVNSNRYVEIKEELDIVTSNIPFCSFNFNTETEELYTAQITDEIIDQPVSTFNADFGLVAGDCQSLVYHEPPYLKIEPICYEGCGFKYRKID